MKKLKVKSYEFRITNYKLQITNAVVMKLSTINYQLSIKQNGSENKIHGDGASFSFGSIGFTII